MISSCTLPRFNFLRCVFGFPAPSGAALGTQSLKRQVIGVEEEVEFLLDRRPQPFDIFAAQSGFTAAFAAEQMMMRFHACDFESFGFAASGGIHQMQFVEEYQVPVYRRPVEGGRFFSQPKNYLLDGHTVPGPADRIQDEFPLRGDAVSAAAHPTRIIQ
jgi:hypothetical protein